MFYVITISSIIKRFTLERTKESLRSISFWNVASSFIMFPTCPFVLLLSAGLLLFATLLLRCEYSTTSMLYNCNITLNIIPEGLMGVSDLIDASSDDNETVVFGVMLLVNVFGVLGGVAIATLSPGA